MNRIHERYILVVIHQDQIPAFEDYINLFSETNKLDIDEIVDTIENTRVCLDFKLPNLISKYSSSFIGSINFLEVKDKETVTFDNCIVWARDLNHIFEHHIEIEIYLLVNHKVQSDIDYRTFSKELGNSTGAKLIYELIDFRHYDLLWYHGNEMKIRVSNIESLGSQEELKEAIKLMKVNIAAHNEAYPPPGKTA